MSGSADRLRWFVGADGEDGPGETRSVRLICLPYAGGGPAVYRSWPAALAGVADVLTVCLPGRAHRYLETRYEDLDRCAAALDAAAAALPQRPTVIFGHSLGALLGFELTRRLAARGRPPALLLVSGCPPPSTVVPRPDPLHARPDDDLVAELRRMAATPEEILGNDEMMRLLLPMLRADFALSERYRYTPAPAVPTPIVTLAGSHDPLAPPVRMPGWDRETELARHVEIDGGHLFLHSAEPEVLAEVRAGIRGVLGGRAHQDA